MCDCYDRKETVVVIYSNAYPKIFGVYNEHTFRRIFTEEFRAIPDEEYVALTDLVNEYIGSIPKDWGIYADIMEVE